MEPKISVWLEKLVYLVILNSLTVFSVVLFGDSRLTSMELIWMTLHAVSYVTLLYVSVYWIGKCVLRCTARR